MGTTASRQLLESVNATYGRVSPKKSNCNRIRGRIASGIIRQNSPEDAPFLIRECCGSSPLTPSVRRSLEKDAHELVERRKKSHESEIMKAKNVSRFKRRGKYKDDPNGDYG